jgi:head-tail adaptor
VLSASDTAYPLLKESPTERELQELFTPNLFELGFAAENTRQPIPRLGLLLLLKSFQKLGYFVGLPEIPPPIVLHVAKTVGWHQIPDGLSTYDASTARFRHMALVRSYLGVTPFADSARKLMLRIYLAGSRVREDLADIVNMTIEELIRQRYELPGFSTLFRAARAARVAVNRGYYRQIYQATDPVARAHIDALFEKGSAERRSSWDHLKGEPGQPTVKRIQAFLVHLGWLRKQVTSTNPLAGIPAVKLQRFAAEAWVLNVARMKELTEEKRFALAAALLFRQLARAYDDAADMLIRQVQRMHHKAKELMKLRQASHLQHSAELVSTLRNVTIAYQQDGTAEQRLQNIGAFLGSDPTRLLERCEEHAALASGIYLQLLPRFFRHPRNALLLLLEHIPLSSTSQD